ncbi:MAG: hypothetical protein LBC77_05150 [Spirochaetaceae bacterium]|jgi:hypothetical protein|nr:hypothetical protein [Spirochaetaceae bacterium]
MRYRLVFTAAFTFISWMVNAEIEAEREPLKALVELSGSDIIENTAFTLIILVNHPLPNEIRLELPPFNEEFFLERIRSKPYLVNGGRGVSRPAESGNDGIWTELELRIVPLTAGALSIEPFSISTPGEAITTLPLQLNVLPSKPVSAGQTAFSSLTWSGPKSVRRGGAAVISLKFTEWRRGMPYPEDIVIPFEAPKNAIVEQLSVPRTQRSEGVLLRLEVRPLEKSDITLKKTAVRYKNSFFTIPEYTIKVINTAAAGEKSENGGADEAADITELVLGPPEERAEKQKPGALPSSFEISAAPILSGFTGIFDGNKFKLSVDAAQAEWEAGHYAESLAVLRGAERDLSAGIRLSGLRSAVESSLYLERMQNEEYRPISLFVLFSALALAGIIFCGAIFVYLFLKNRRFPQKLIVLSGFLCALFLLTSAFWLLAMREHGKSAVLRETNIYSVPEELNGGAKPFAEGTPVTIKTKSGEWLYVQTHDGSSGWVKSAAAVIY